MADISRVALLLINGRLVPVEGSKEDVVFLWGCGFPMGEWFPMGGGLVA